MLDRTIFFDSVRKSLFRGVLTHSQVDGMNAILDEWERRGLGDVRWLAYMLATALHETAQAMQPVLETRQPSEGANPSVDQAIRRLENSWAAGRMPWVKTPYWRKNAAGLSYLGRGLPQLTGIENYRKMSPICGVDLVSHPDQALEPDVAVTIMFEGMIRGSYTGHRLGEYFSASAGDPISARRIINALQLAGTVAGYHHKFHVGLLAASAQASAPRVAARPSVVVDASLSTPKRPDPYQQPLRPLVPASTPPKSLWARLGALFSRKAA